MYNNDAVYDEKGKIRFIEGTKKCGLCKTKKNIIQFERHIKRKGLPIIEIAFLCRSCGEKQDLINRSTKIEEE